MRLRKRRLFTWYIEAISLGLTDEDTCFSERFLSTSLASAVDQPRMKARVGVNTVNTAHNHVFKRQIWIEFISRQIRKPISWLSNAL